VTEEDKSATLGPGSYLRLSFQDSGRGIPPADLPRIFEPYFSTKEVGSRRGQGLSLALCRAIIGAHGGSVTAAPLESGSVLQVLLPVAAITP
jgi:signal transduction histidine kinase